MLVKKNATDVSTYVFLGDSATGVPETGLTITNIDATYTRLLEAAVKNDLTALAAVTTAHTDNKGIEIDATNAPGIYRIDWPDAAFATGVDKVTLSVTCSGCHPAHERVQLVDFDPTDGVRMGMTALPNAAAEAAGGLYTRGTGAGQINQDANGRINSNVAAWLGTAPETPDTAGVPNVNMVYLNNSATTVDNIGNVFGTDFATNYDDTNNRWLVDVRRLGGTAVSANSAANWHTLYENDAQVSATELSDVASATKMKVYFGLALRKDAAIASDRATELAEINFNWGAGAGAYVSTTDANEALRDRGDAAWITATGFSTLDAAGVRTAIGLASANLDTQIGTLATAANLSTVAGYLDTEIAAILADTNELQTDWANGGRLDLLLDGCATPSQVNAEVLDVINVDTLIDGKTIKEAVRAIAATTTAKVSGAGTGTEIFVGMDGTTVRVTATVDASGNRTAVVYG